jgi:NADPH2:quinone reductase
MIRAVKCHEFACFDKISTAKEGVSSSSRRPKFRQRSKRKKVNQVLALEYLPRPALSPTDNDKVLIKTCYAGIQYPDFLQAMGLYQVRPQLPYIPGMDVTGYVKQISSSNASTGLKVGDRVMATMLQHGGTGAMAEYVIAPSALVYKIPDNVPLEACSNIGRNYFAAYHSLKTIGKVGPTSLVLVDGASGGVGMATIELAKAMGAKVSCFLRIF